MDEREARKKLTAALESSLRAYRAVSAVEARALAAHAAFNYLMSIGIETRLLAPLVELATQNQREKQILIGSTKPATYTFRRVAGSAAISAILERARTGQSLPEVAKRVAEALGGIKPGALINYRTALMAGRQSRDASTLYKEFSEVWLKPVFDAYPQGGQDLEKFVLSLIRDIAPVEPGEM